MKVSISFLRQSRKQNTKTQTGMNYFGRSRSEKVDLMFDHVKPRMSTAIRSDMLENADELEDSDKHFYLYDEFIGFPEPEDEEVLKFHQDWLSKTTDKHEEAIKAWKYFFTHQNGGIDKPIEPDNSNLKTLIRKYEIPSRYRNKLWKELTKVDKLLKENEGYYDKILEVHKDQACQAAQQIEMDLARTFPQHPYFNNENAPGCIKMRRILTAYSWRNPFVSYCQSLNFIVGILLLHFSEQEVFWMLVAILENMLPANFYNPTLTGLRVDGKVLSDLIHERLPKISNHFKEYNVDPTAFCTGWFMRLFVGIFPIRTTLRVWDLFFSEGSKILFRVALSYLKINEKEILQRKHMGDILRFLNMEPQKQYDHAVLIKNCFSFYYLTRKEIDALRKKWFDIVAQEDKELELKRQRMRELRKKEKEKEEELERVQYIETDTAESVDQAAFGTLLE